jgi:hypothetical protein
MRILSLDPGKRTGWCHGWVGSDGMLMLEPGEDDVSLGGMYDMLSRAVEQGAHIIYEDFAYRNYARTGLDLTPVKIIGVIELYREWHEPFVTFTKQSAATGKAFYNDDRLKKLGVYWPHGKGHARDATRHLLQWANFGAGGQYLNVNEIQMVLVDTYAK